MSYFNYEEYYPHKEWNVLINNYSFESDIWGIYYAPTSRCRQILGINLIKNWINDKKLRFLDIGGGIGFHTLAISKIFSPGTNGILLDISLRGIKLAATSPLNHISGFSLLQGDAEHLPIEDNSIDFVVCSEVLEHVPNDKQVLNEMFRILRPGGFVYISVPLELVAKKRYWHVRTYRSKTLYQNLNESNFEIKEFVQAGIVTSLSWETIKPFVYLFWLIISGNISKFLFHTPMTSYYLSKFHQESILPLFDKILFLDQLLPAKVKFRIGTTIHCISKKPITA